ncbi:MAG: hypothetical protein D3925_14435, partial [Candidatus Electrothrix sp. AR5]|nr:hypothetical protein [Candidatus Electrothrix sp. AR5]
MKLYAYLFGISILFSLLFVPLLAQATDDVDRGKIQIKVEKDNLLSLKAIKVKTGDVLKELEQVTGITIKLIDPAVLDETMSIKLQKVPIDTAVKRILKKNYILTYSKTANKEDDFTLLSVGAGYNSDKEEKEEIGKVTVGVIPYGNSQESVGVLITEEGGSMGP